MTSAKDDVLKLLQERKAADESAEQPDWEAVRDEWIADVEGLYALLRNWLADAEKNSLVAIQADVVTLHEEHMGSYDAPALRLEFPGAVVRVRPVGRLIVGAKGRLDFERPPRKAVVLREGAAQWVVAEKGGGSRGWTRHAFDQEAFWAVIGELIG